MIIRLVVTGWNIYISKDKYKVLFLSAAKLCWATFEYFECGVNVVL